MVLNNETEDVHLRCSRKHLPWVFGGAAPFIVFLIVGSIRSAEPYGFLSGIALLTLTGAFMYAMTFWISVRITNGELIYRSPFGFKRRIPIIEIRYLKSAMGGDDRSRPDSRLVVVPTKSSTTKGFDINEFFLSNEDTRFLRERFGKKKQVKSKIRNDREE